MIYKDIKLSISCQYFQLFTIYGQQGESLWDIAQKFGASWEAIYQENIQTIGSDPNLIQPGMVLNIGW